MLLLPSNLFRFASLSLEFSSPKNMSELMDLAFPNLFTASAPAGPEEIGAGDDFFGLLSKSESQEEDFEADFDTFSFKSCSQADLLDLFEGAHMLSTLELEL